MQHTERCSLVIIGAGYAGVNALNAASKYLAKGSRVVIVDRGYRWGGMWSHVYSHVRLHQPYQLFTAGERDWSISGLKPPSYLAKKNEILAHFEDIVSAVLEETSMDLIVLWGHEYRGHTVEGGQVKLSAMPIEGTVDGTRPIIVVADKMIKAAGFDVLPKQPLIFPAASGQIHSLVPGDILAPQWRALLRYPADAGATIWIVGSGKTAMDAIIALSSLGPSVRGRLKCIAGRGTWFTNRDFGAAPHCFFDMFEMYDGTNAQEIYKEMSGRGFLHTAVPDPECFALGACSPSELDVVREVLSPARERVIKAHLVDVVAQAQGGLSLKLRSLDRKTIFEEPLACGSVIINCTDNLVGSNQKIDPIVSPDGLVLAPQDACGFSGPTAHVLTHAWFLGTLGDLWRQLPRVNLLDPTKKQVLGLHLSFPVIISTQIVASLLPKEVRNSSKAFGAGPVDPAFRKRAGEAIPGIIAKMQRLFPLRYDDSAVQPAGPFDDVVGGRIGGGWNQMPRARL